MKWGRKKSSHPPSSSPISIIARVFPWFSKKGGSNLESKNKCVFDFPTPNLKQGRFYSMDEDDAYWRLSFGEERVQGRKSTGGINPLWYDDCGHDFQIPVSDLKSFDLTEMEASRKEDCKNFTEMVSDIKRMKEKRGKQRTVANNGGKTSGDGEARVSTRSRKSLNDQMPRKSRGLGDGEAAKISNSVERNIFPKQRSPIIDQRSVLELKNVEGMKLKGIKIKPESKKKSACVKRDQCHSRRVKSYSPRTECKIRALEEMKKARTKAKQKEKVLEGKTIFDSLAVVKSSYNPQQDFRDSMVEMIREKEIGHPEDLEQLLACYLTLNCDEYHDLIIKVFRQVWFELKGVYIHPPL